MATGTGQRRRTRTPSPARAARTSPKHAHVPLGEYRRKRRFHVTPEPSGTKAPPRPRRRRALAFVVQKHRAGRLHYDFRLEWNGVLLSWAVPKGPSLDPTVKRLAMQVEDHPLAYADFEGIIPEGEYGGGTVMVWDEGTYVPETPDVGKAVEVGELTITLLGRKLVGSWVLVRTRDPSGRPGPSRTWLLIKHRDAGASTADVTVTAPCSVKSGRLLAEIAIEEGGNVRKAATGDPPDEIRALMQRIAKKPLRRRRTPSVWHSGSAS